MYSTKRGDIKVRVEGDNLVINYRGDERSFPAYFREDSATASRVFGGKFKTGTKIWPLAVTVWFASGNVNIENGGFANKGGVSSVLGWFDPESKNATQFRGAR